MTKSVYYRLALTMPRQWLTDCIAAPSPSMRPIHILLARLALRDMGRKA